MKLRMEHGAGDLLMRTLTQLAEAVRFVQARTPGDFEARLKALGDDGLAVATRPESERHPGGWWR